MAEKRPSLIVALAGLGILLMGAWFLWKGSVAVTDRIRKLPIHGAQTVAQSRIEEPKTDKLKVLYPLLIASQPSAAPQATGEFIDKAFLRQAARASTAPQEATTQQQPDFFQLLPAHLTLDAIVGAGAVISGTYYEVGDALEKFAYPGKSGKMVTPILAGVQADSAMIREGAGRRHLILRLAGSAPDW